MEWPHALGSGVRLEVLKDLRAAVNAGLASGMTLEDMLEEIRLEKYDDWAFYERLLPKAIEATYENMTVLRFQ